METNAIYQKKAGSSYPRLFVVLSGLLLLAAGLHILFAEELWPGYAPDTGNLMRSQLLAITMGITAARILFTLLYLLRRSMNWEEALGIPFAFLLYFVFYGALVRYNPSGVGWLEWAGFVVFFAGSAINTGSELARHFWKQKPENKGNLYTKGGFGLARHINYTGDIIWVSGMACITASPYSLLVVAFIFCFFAFFNGPMLDRYLAERYGDQYIAWEQKTKSLIPGIF
ncbi:MAG: hypothetical protein CMN76_17150 [Spirochaetaceae bacterium]|nr:hypothetical protein [Spirochaetaceae bacterium]|tara:strand:+ start:52898 stop:53581 length:684 start_codon:yes stop_codon:yes gene_type:complete